MNKPKYPRIFLIVTDSLGVGGDPKAKRYLSEGANTFLHASETGLLKIPTWKKLGIESIVKLTGHTKVKNQLAYTARLEEVSNAKDTLAGHWEMMGVKTEVPFPTFTEHGFPKEVIDQLEKLWKRKIVGNKAASGVEILNELWKEEINNNKVIIYTSADSNMQICGHEKHMGLKTLYSFCEMARKLLDSRPEWRVGRVIARPYIGEEGHFTRTANRHDYAVPPFKKTILEELVEHKIDVLGIGKIHDIFVGRGMNRTEKGESDDENMDFVIEEAKKPYQKPLLVFANLVDFDSKYGHRRDPQGYAENINRFDIKLAKLINVMQEDDLLMITSDHGTDPIHAGFDHTREHVPLTIYAKNFKEKPKFLGLHYGFGAVGNIVARNFGVATTPLGDDLFDDIK